MTTPIPHRQRREVLSDDGERWLRGEPAGAFPYLTRNLAEIWAAHAERVVSEHIARWPGSRPRRWWQYSVREPRMRLGGIGDTMPDAGMAHAPHFEFGLPTAWRRLGDGFTKGTPVDPADPPRFESEASYLLRLGLLLPGEREQLKPMHFRSVRIR